MIGIQREADDDQIEFLGPRGLGGFSPSRSDRHFMTVAGEGFGDPLRNERISLRNENGSLASVIGGERGLAFFETEIGTSTLAQPPFVHHHLQAQQRADARQQRDVVDGLGEEIVGAGLKPAHAVGDSDERGDHDDRHVRWSRDWP